MSVTYGRTPLGQLLFDLLFTRLKPQYLARKHHLPVGEVRQLRERTLAAYRGARKTKQWRKRTVADARDLINKVRERPAP